MRVLRSPGVHIPHTLIFGPDACYVGVKHKDNRMGCMGVWEVQVYTHHDNCFGPYGLYTGPTWGQVEPRTSVGFGV